VNRLWQCHCVHQRSLVQCHIYSFIVIQCMWYSLNVQNGDLLFSLTLIPLFDFSQFILIKWDETRGWQVSFHHSPAMLQITVSSVKLRLLLDTCDCSFALWRNCFFSHLMYFMLPKLVCLIEDKISCISCFLILFYILILVFHKFWKPSSFFYFENIFQIMNFVILVYLKVSLEIYCLSFHGQVLAMGVTFTALR
jgi:hypothetical protein